MAPRFVEVSRPVEEGVAWASTLPTTVSTRVRTWMPENTTDIIMQRLDMLYESIPEIRFATDLQSAANDVVALLPEARHETKYLLLAAVAAAVLRWLFVVLTSRSILKAYGATKMMKEE